MLNMEKKEEIILKMVYEQKKRYYKCDINELLEKYIIDFVKSINVDYSSIYVLYNGISLFGEALKKPISQIIKSQDKKDKIMTLLLDKNTIFNINDEDEIIIVLSIESVKIVKLNGKKGEIIRDIIKNSSLIKFDLKWCIFKYKENEIDINKKYNDITNDEDKRKSEIIITLNYSIPLIVNFVKGNKKN